MSELSSCLRNGYLPLLQGEGRGEDGFNAGSTKPIPTLILPLKGRRLNRNDGMGDCL